MKGAITAAIRIAYTDPMSSWWGYVQKIASGQSQTQIAERTGLSQGGISAWQSKTPKPESVVLFARTYGRPVVEAFVAAGWMSDEEARITQIPATLTDIPSTDLVKELGRRLGVDAT